MTQIEELKKLKVKGIEKNFDKLVDYSPSYLEKLVRVCKLLKK